MYPINPLPTLYPMKKAPPEPDIGSELKHAHREVVVVHPSGDTKLYKNIAVASRDTIISGGSIQRLCKHEVASVKGYRASFIPSH